jgi:hypothetical protein
MPSASTQVDPSASAYRSHAPNPVQVAPMDDAYDYTASGSRDNHYDTYNATMNQQHPNQSMNSYDDNEPAQETSVDGEEALLDLAQLEELQIEAEKMKGLGNKHMAAQVSDCL